MHSLTDFNYRLLFCRWNLDDFMNVFNTCVYTSRPFPARARLINQIYEVRDGLISVCRARSKTIEELLTHVMFFVKFWNVEHDPKEFLDGFSFGWDLRARVNRTLYSVIHFMFCIGIYSLQWAFSSVCFVPLITVFNNCSHHIAELRKASFTSAKNRYTSNSNFCLACSIDLPYVLKFQSILLWTPGDLPPFLSRRHPIYAFYDLCLGICKTE